MKKLKVKHLIKQLQELDPDCDVQIEFPEIDSDFNETGSVFVGELSEVTSSGIAAILKVAYE